MKTAVILGAGGHARTTFFDLKDSYSDFVFVDDVTETTSLALLGKTYPVVKDWSFSRFSQMEFIVGTGNPQTNKIMVEKAIASGLRPMPTYIHPTVVVCNASVGYGGLVKPLSILDFNAMIGDYVILNISSTIGHDSKIENFCVFGPHCSISGGVTVGEACWFGSATVVRENLKVGANCITGLNCGIVKNITEPGLYLGTPAKKHQH